MAARGGDRGPARLRAAHARGARGARRRVGLGGAAREAGASGAAIALAEVREELADGFVVGLASLGPRVAEPLAARLADLGLPKQAELLRAIAGKPDSEARLDDFVKLYQVLGIALVRLAGATEVDRASLTRAPTYESVFVRRPAEWLAPREIVARRAAGALNRYEAAVQYAHHYESLPGEELAASIYPTWADGSAAPYVVRAFAGRREEGLAAAKKALAGKGGRVAKITALRVLAAAGGLEAERILDAAATTEKDIGLRALAADARDAIERRRGGALAVERRRAPALEKVALATAALASASTRDVREAAVHALVELGHLGAIPALRQAFLGDASQEVRREAGLALAALGDTEMVDTFVDMLARRGEDDREAKAAAGALGRLGDVRGLRELLAAYAEGYKPRRGGRRAPGDGAGRDRAARGADRGAAVDRRAEGGARRARADAGSGSRGGAGGAPLAEGRRGGLRRARGAVPEARAGAPRLPPRGGAGGALDRAGRRREQGADQGREEGGELTPTRAPRRGICRPRRVRRPVLMKRTFGFDVLTCPRCSRRMRLMATIMGPATIRKILDHLRVRADALPRGPARDPTWNRRPTSGSRRRREGPGGPVGDGGQAKGARGVRRPGAPAGQKRAGRPARPLHDEPRGGADQREGPRVSYSPVPSQPAEGAVAHRSATSTTSAFVGGGASCTRTVPSAYAVLASRLTLSLRPDWASPKRPACQQGQEEQYASRELVRGEPAERKGREVGGIIGNSSRADNDLRGRVHVRSGLDPTPWDIDRHGIGNAPSAPGSGCSRKANRDSVTGTPNAVVPCTAGGSPWNRGR